MLIGNVVHYFIGVEVGTKRVGWLGENVFRAL